MEEAATNQAAPVPQPPVWDSAEMQAMVKLVVRLERALDETEMMLGAVRQDASRWFEQATEHAQSVSEWASKYEQLSREKEAIDEALDQSAYDLAQSEAKLRVARKRR